MNTEKVGLKVNSISEVEQTLRVLNVAHQEPIPHGNENSSNGDNS